jgi:predicted nucleotidyltransferase
LTRAGGCATDLAAACADLLGPVVAAVIRHGSLAFAQFAPGCSDIDILVVVDRSLSEAECVGLEELGNRLGAGAPVAIDFRVVTRRRRPLRGGPPWSCTSGSMPTAPPRASLE